MNRKVIFVIVCLLLTALATSACFPGLPVSGRTNESQVATQNAIIMQAVESTATTMAMQAQISQLETKLAQANTPQAPDNTAAPTQVAAATTEATFTGTPVPPTPTNTPIPPTDTPVPPTATQPPPTATSTNTPTPIPCNQALFISDVTIQDGTVFLPGASFTKTWRLKNVGACTWTTSYDIVFIDGNKMDAPSAIDMPGNVTNGQVIDISITMVAPTSAGRYRSNWKIRDASGVLFGVGLTSASFYADIRVLESSSSTPLDFVARMCEAGWSNGSEVLPCAGANDDARGFVRRIDNPTLESGYTDDEPVLLMNPQMVADGMIRGKYPAFHVENGHHFISTIGCAYKANACDVIFRLDYQIGSDSIKTMKTWYEIYDEKFAFVDVDLSSLAGKDVKFILTVLANGASNQDRAQWLVPQVVKR